MEHQSNYLLQSQAEPFKSVELITDRIKQELAKVTLNADSWEDIYLITRLEKFFALRRGKYRKGQLKERFHALQRLIEAQRILRIYEPDKVRSLIKQLRGFERLCKCCGIQDYHLTIQYKPALVVIFFAFNHNTTYRISHSSTGCNELLYTLSTY
jgi:hypothetical protein